MAQMKKSAPSKAPAKAGKAVADKSLVQDITNRFRVTAREARDIVTAVGTHMNAYNPKQPVNKNLARQIKEVGVAAVTGKKGTTSDVIPTSGTATKMFLGKYKPGTKR